MQCVLYYANIVHIDVNIISRAPLSPVGDIHRLSCTKMKNNVIVCIPTIDEEAPEIANIMQREHNRFYGGQPNISYNADCFSNDLLIVALII